ncbi:MAG: HD domain-containing protein [Nanoarchaeota archaeon]|nr:HD domain-containing protein [Nanoarchaeota archaeon]
MDHNIEKIREIVADILVCKTHDMDHTNRVYNISLYLASHEQDVDLGILKPAVLLHDIGRIKEDSDNSGNTDHATIGAKMAGEILLNFNYSNEDIDKISHCISAHRYRGEIKAETIEAKILFDADKIDVLGAIGLARSFTSNGQYGQIMYTEQSVEEYVKENFVEGKITGRIKDPHKHSPQMEYETKFKFISNKLYTEKGKQVAKERLEYMSDFFKRLKQEIAGEF